MKLDEAKAIYRAKYWNAQRCDELPPGVDYSIFDYGVNSGIGRSGKVLRRVVGLPDNTSRGQRRGLRAVAKRDPKALVVAINDERLRSSSISRPGRCSAPAGADAWRRCAPSACAWRRKRVRRRPSSTDTAPAPGKGAVPAPAGIKKVIVGTGTAAPVAAGGSHWDWVAAHPWETAAIACGVALAVGGSIYVLNRWHQRGQEAAIPQTPLVPELAV